MLWVIMYAESTKTQEGGASYSCMALNAITSIMQAVPFRAYKGEPT